MKANVKVTEGIFKAIKALIKDGASNVECARYMGVSDSTCSIIRNSEDYE